MDIFISLSDIISLETVTEPLTFVEFETIQTCQSMVTFRMLEDRCFQESHRWFNMHKSYWFLSTSLKVFLEKGMLFIFWKKKILEFPTEWKCGSYILTNWKKPGKRKCKWSIWIITNCSDLAQIISKPGKVCSV